MDFNLNTLKKNWKIFTVSMAILIFANAFNGTLNISSFEKIFTSSLVSIYYDSVSGLKQNIERKIRFGKPLDNFYGMDLLLEEFKEKNPTIHNISIARPNGTILYSLDPKTMNIPLPQKLLGYFSDRKTGKGKEGYEHNGYFHVFLEIENLKKDNVGIIIITFPEKIVNEQINKMICWNLNRLCITTAIVCILLFFWMMNFTNLNEKNFKRQRLYYTLFIFLGMGQIVYSYQSLNYFHERHKQIIQLKTQGVQNQLQTEIEKFIQVGLPIDKLGKMEKRLKQITDSADYIDVIHVLNTDRQLLYSSGNREPIPLNEQNDLVLSTSLEAKESLKGFIQTRISKSEIQKKILESVLDSLTVIFISMIFITEMLFLLFVFI